MAYQKTKWVNDSLPAINAGNLNKIENGIAESNIFRNLFNVGNAKISTNTGLNFDKTNNRILINGSSTTGTDIFLDSPKANKDEEGIILKAGTYTATIKKTSGSLSDKFIQFYLRKSDGSSVYDGTTVSVLNVTSGASDDTVYSDTFTLEEETRLHWLGYFGSDQITFNNLILDFQIEENTEATKYTPFAGYMVESGSNDNGSWVKFSDGTMVCKKKFVGKANVEKTWGVLYENEELVNLGDFPKDFISADDLIVLATPYNIDIYIESIKNTTKNSWGYIRFGLPNLNSNYSFELNLFAIGRWK